MKGITIPELAELVIKVRSEAKARATRRNEVATEIAGILKETHKSFTTTELTEKYSLNRWELKRILMILNKNKEVRAKWIECRLYYYHSDYHDELQELIAGGTP